MPGILYQPSDRRRFLWNITKTSAALALTVSSRSWAAGGADAKPIRLALFSDTHIPADPTEEYRKFNPRTNLKSLVSQVLESRPDGAIATGDLARLAGEVGDYEALKELLTPLVDQCPVYLGMGNHDSKENFDKVFSKTSGDLQSVAGKRVVLVNYPGVRFLVLDSLLYTSKTAGLLGKAQRKWLETFLASGDESPVVMFVHHTLGDGDGELLDSEMLMRMVRPSRKVKAIVYGHSHRYEVSEVDGIHLVNLPAVGYNFRDEDPVGWVDAKFGGSGVELTLRVCGGKRELDGRSKSLIWRT